MFIGRIDVEAEPPILWPPHVKSWLIGKDPDAGKDWGQEEKGTTEDEMAGWHHRLDGHEFEWTPRVGFRQGGLACCSSWGHKESDTTEWLNWTELNHSMPGLSVHHQLLEFTQTHVHQVCDAIQPSHPLSSPSPPAPNPSQHQGLFQWDNSLHEVARVLEF